MNDGFAQRLDRPRAWRRHKLTEPGLWNAYAACPTMQFLQQRPSLFQIRRAEALLRTSHRRGPGGRDLGAAARSRRRRARLIAARSSNERAFERSSAFAASRSGAMSSIRWPCDGVGSHHFSPDASAIAMASPMQRRAVSNCPRSGVEQLGSSTVDPTARLQAIARPNNSTAFEVSPPNARRSSGPPIP